MPDLKGFLKILFYIFCHYQGGFSGVSNYLAKLPERNAGQQSIKPSYLTGDDLFNPEITDLFDQRPVKFYLHSSILTEAPGLKPPMLK